jgi:hypothetical protein
LSSVTPDPISESGLRPCPKLPATVPWRFTGRQRAGRRLLLGVARPRASRRSKADCGGKLRMKSSPSPSIVSVPAAVVRGLTGRQRVPIGAPPPVRMRDREQERVPPVVVNEVSRGTTLARHITVCFPESGSGAGFPNPSPDGAAGQPGASGIRAGARPSTGARPARQAGIRRGAEPGPTSSIATDHRRTPPGPVETSGSRARERQGILFRCRYKPPSDFPKLDRDPWVATRGQRGRHTYRSWRRDASAETGDRPRPTRVTTFGHDHGL